PGSIAWIAGASLYGNGWKSLNAEDRRIIGEDIKDVEFSWPIAMPLVGSLGRERYGKFEAICHSVARRAFCLRRTRVHGAPVRFMKKTQKTPKADIDLAVKRKKGGRV